MAAQACPPPVSVCPPPMPPVEVCPKPKPPVKVCPKPKPPVEVGPPPAPVCCPPTPPVCCQPPAKPPCCIPPTRVCPCAKAQAPPPANQSCVSGPGHPYCGSPPGQRPAHTPPHVIAGGHHHRHFHKVVTNPVQAPCAFTRDAIVSALRSGCINFVRIGGLSGFLAVAIGAYAAYVFAQDSSNGSSSSSYSGSKQSSSRGRSSECGDGGYDETQREIFNIANRYHFVHSLALLATPMYKCPNLTGGLLTAGIILFCGSCYIHVLTGNKDVSKVTPYGGVLLISAWVSMIL